MEGLFRLPEQLSLEGNIAENWRKFSQKFNNFLRATELDQKNDEKKVAAFLNLVGDEDLGVI